MSETINLQSGFEKAFENELKCCKYIHRFGGLTTRQLGRLVWPEANQGMRMAQRTCARMVKDKRLISRKLPTGGVIYVIGERGSRFLIENDIHNVNSRGGRDITFSKPYHRMVSNDYLIDYLLQGQSVWTEHEIQQGFAPVPDVSIDGRKKIPDGLVCLDHEYLWIEVENAPKSKLRLGELMSLGELLFANSQYYKYIHNGRQHFIGQLSFVVTNRACAMSTYKALKERFAGKGLSNELQIEIVKMSQGLVWCGHKDSFQVGDFEYFEVDDFMRKLDEVF